MRKYNKAVLRQDVYYTYACKVCEKNDISTPMVAQASAVIYSRSETAKETGLGSFRYLTWASKNAPGLDWNMESWAKSLLPANAPEDCRLR